MGASNNGNGTTEPSSLHRTMRDLRGHDAWIYWTDLLLCAAVFWASIDLGSQSLPWFLVALTIGGLARYRMALFTHEICHLKADVLPGFALVWNTVCGIPILLPSYMLKSHVDHHSIRSYGTPADPEYLPFATYPQLRSRFLVGSALVPVAMLVRALIVVPLAWFRPRVHVYLRERMTFMSMNNAYRPGTFQRLTSADRVYEGMASVWAWALLVASAVGALSWHIAALLLACMTLANLLNGWRTLHAHRYTSQGQAMDAKAQLRDSTTFTTHWLWGELLCPVGQRFHAAHHLLPYLPYHALPEAHRRLISTEWPGKADYLATFTCGIRQ
jgi:fatty acid desaturase